MLNGSDSLGNTQIEVTSNSVRYASAGGIDNSTSTREGYRTVRHGVGTAATAAVLGIGLSQAASAYSANQAAAATSNVAASRSAAAIAASKGATMSGWPRSRRRRGCGCSRTSRCECGGENLARSGLDNQRSHACNHCTGAMMKEIAAGTVFSIVIMLLFWLLACAISGCAAPERRAPIDYYREQYGFPT